MRWPPRLTLSLVVLLPLRSVPYSCTMFVAFLRLLGFAGFSVATWTNQVSDMTCS